MPTFGSGTKEDPLRMILDDKDLADIEAGRWTTLHIDAVVDEVRRLRRIIAYHEDNCLCYGHPEDRKADRLDEFGKGEA